MNKDMQDLLMKLKNNLISLINLNEEKAEDLKRGERQILLIKEAIAVLENQE